MLVHAGVSLLLLLLGLRLGLGTPGSLAAALRFAAHPVHAEAVAWVSGRSELLAAGCVLAAWLAHLSQRRAAAGWSAAIRRCRSSSVAPSGRAMRSSDAPTRSRPAAKKRTRMFSGCYWFGEVASSELRSSMIRSTGTP
jgi:hypothetical protein